MRDGAGVAAGAPGLHGRPGKDALHRALDRVPHFFVIFAICVLSAFGVLSVICMLSAICLFFTLVVLFAFCVLYVLPLLFAICVFLRFV